MDRAVFVESQTIDRSIIEAVKATNPQFRTHNPAFMENCQRCVSAYEARRRGYNVVAKPRVLAVKDNLPYMNSEKGWPAVYQDYRLVSCAALTPELAKRKVESVMGNYGTGSRAIIKVNWKFRFKGHVFIAENQEQTIRFLDPQTGNLDVSWYFRYADPASIVVMRIDHLQFTELASQCFGIPNIFTEKQ